MLTTLDIINTMLASTGTAPLTSNDTNHPAYKKALNKLNAVSRTVQTKGWWFNKSVITFKRNTSGEIVLPSYTLHADPYDTGTNLVIRDGKLFDLSTRSHVLDEDVKVRFVELVALEDMPSAANEYIKARAVYEYYLDAGGTNPKLTEYKDMRNDAWVAFKAEHLRNADVNFFDGASQLERRRGNWSRTTRLPLRDH